MLLMDDFSLLFVNDWHVSLLNVLLVYDRLNMFMNHWSVMLMNHVLVNFIDHVLMVLMHNFSVGVFDYGALHDCVSHGCLLMLDHLSGSDIRPRYRCLIVSDDFRYRDVLDSSLLHHRCRR